MSSSPNRAGFPLTLALLAFAALPAGSDTATAGDAAAQAGGFETFTVAKPGAHGSGAPAPGSKSAKEERKKHRRPPAKDRINGQAIFTYFPGITDFTLDAAGEIGGRQVNARFSPLRMLEGDFSNPGFLEFAKPNGGGIRAGDDSSELMGGTQGLRLFRTDATATSTSGIGLYKRLRGNASNDVQPALDNRWILGKELQAGMLIAGDSSWRTTVQTKGKGWQASGFMGKDVKTDQREMGLFAEREIVPGTTAIVRGFLWSGERPGSAFSGGLLQRLGRAFLSVDQSVRNGVDDQQSELGVGLLVPFKREALSLRWQHGSIHPRSEGIFGTRTSDTVSANLQATLGSRTTLWGGGGTSWETDGENRPYVTLGARRQLSSLWDAQAEISQRLDADQKQLRLSIGYRVHPDWTVRLMYGPSMQAGENGHTFGFQIARNLRASRSAQGTIRGTVLLDGKPVEQRFGILLDDEEPVNTDSKGKFQLRNVAVGARTVRLDPATLPADLSADQQSFQLQIADHKTAEVAFKLYRVRQIRGMLRVQPDAFGNVDPTAGVGVSITAGEGVDTTTNAEGEFVLGNLRPGKYVVRLEAGTIPPDYQVVGPREVEVQITIDGPLPDLVFTIAPRVKKIEIAEGIDS